MRWVHSTCIVEWLRLNPAVPLSCGICGEAFDVAFSDDGEAFGLAYFDSELDDPGHEDSGLVTVLLVAFIWMLFMCCAETAIYTLGHLPPQIFPGRNLVWVIIGIVVAAIYCCCIVLKVSILILGGPEWQPQDWGARFACADMVLEPLKVCLADAGIGLRSLAFLIGATSVKSMFAMAMNYPLQRSQMYCGPRVVMLSSTANLIALTWVLKRAFLDKQPMVSEVRGEFLNTALRQNRD